MDIDNIISNCLKKWDINPDNPDARISHFQNIFNDFIKQFDDYQKNIVFKLLDNFLYYSHNCINEFFKKSYEQICELDICDISVFTYIKKKNGTLNSSNVYLVEFININGIENSKCFDNYKKMEEYIKNNNIEYIIFIDDFLGTGKSFISSLEEDINIYNNKKLILININIMENAIKNIENFAKKIISKYILFILIE